MDSTLASFVVEDNEVVSLHDFLDDKEFFFVESSSEIGLDLVSVLLVVSLAFPVVDAAFQLGVFFFHATKENPINFC